MNGQGPKGSAVLSNSEAISAVEDQSEGAGVSLVSERGTTLPRVKVSKYRLNEEGSLDPQTVGL